jgi:protein-serine/threonine kinase
MSSAALASPPLLPNSPSNRQYTSTHSSPTREAYNATQNNSNNSPSSRRPSRQRSGNGASGGAASTNYSQAASASPMTSRPAIPSPVPVTAASPDSQSVSSDRRKHNIPPVAPPRTSSSNHNGSGERSKRSGQTGDKGASPSRRGEGSRGEVNGNIDTTIMEDGHVSSSRSRRAQIAQDPPTRSSSNREGRTGGITTIVPIHTQAPSSQPTTTTSSKQPSREASEVLNRIIISQPEIDIEREKERMAEAQPHPVGDFQHADDAAPLPVVGSADQDDSRRGGRRGHEHPGKRDKIIKFGEYVLGNTIGEGEFGKVKLGWKQDGGAQVCAVTALNSCRFC